MREYRDNLPYVQGNRHYELYMYEKIRHSFQVSGAGNGILKHEKYFADRNKEFIDIARTAILLHDIYRFREIRGLFEENKAVDHSVLGAEFLRQINEFNNILITLPIKHHGHMIEEFYKDEEYQKQNPEVQEQLKHIAFAVRDADKIANWYLLCCDFEGMKDVWLPYPDDVSDKQTQINEVLWDYFKKDEVAPRGLGWTNADKLICVLAWFFDVNYGYSIDYCKKLKVFEGLHDILLKIHMDEEKADEIFQILKNYGFQRFQVEI